MLSRRDTQDWLVGKFCAPSKSDIAGPGSNESLARQSRKRAHDFWGPFSRTSHVPHTQHGKHHYRATAGLIASDCWDERMAEAPANFGTSRLCVAKCQSRRFRGRLLLARSQLWKERYTKNERERVATKD